MTCPIDPLKILIYWGLVIKIWRIFNKRSVISADDGINFLSESVTVNYWHDGFKHLTFSDEPLAQIIQNELAREW